MSTPRLLVRETTHDDAEFLEVPANVSIERAITVVTGEVVVAIVDTGDARPLILAKSRDMSENAVTLIADAWAASLVGE